jgi:dynein heavy chain
MEGLGGEEERWKESLAVVKLGLRTIIPDVLLGAVIIAYLGPFTQMYRKQATTQWIKLMKSY